MLKKLLLFCSVFCTTSLLLGQVDSKSQVKQWVSEHPEVKLMKSSEYQQLTDNQKVELTSLAEKIIYSNHLTMGDISAYENAENKLIPRSEVEFIFDWKQTHPEIKIVQRSYFNSLSTEKQLIYITADALILMADELTKKDILLYEHTH